MPWREFVQLLSGIGPDTPLGRIVSIRSEKDPKIVKNFSPEQKRVRSEWQRKKAKKMAPETVNDALEGFKRMFISMAAKPGR